jgi:adenosine deaminase
VEDERLVERLVAEQVPLTVCPLSNVKLRVFDRIEDHTLAALLRRGVRVTVNSDDPAYFGGYVGANYEVCADALALTDTELCDLARSSFRASYLAPGEQRGHLDAIDAIAGAAE